MTLKLGVFTVMLPELTPEEAAKALQESGYAGVEWRMTTPSEKRNDPPSFWGNNRCTLTPTAEDARRAKALAARHHLATPNLGSYVPVGDLAAAEAAMNFAKLAGIPSVRVGSKRAGQLRRELRPRRSVSERSDNVGSRSRCQSSRRDPSRYDLSQRRVDLPVGITL